MNAYIRLSLRTVAAALILGLGTAACQDDDTVYVNEIGSYLESTHDARITTFYLANDVARVEAKTPQDIKFILTPDEGSPIEFDGNVAELEDGRLECRVFIPRDTSIPDGVYTISARLPGGETLGGRWQVMFRDNILHKVSGSQAEYHSMHGSGTKEDPYLVRNSGDFDKMIWNIREFDSEKCGQGLYFKQTADFDAPDVSIDIDGVEYASVPFAGNYDGGGHSINRLFYTGSKRDGKDANVGLFTELREGANISHLTLDVDMRGIRIYGGAVAGAVSGASVLNDITVKGSMSECGSSVGGLVGEVRAPLEVNGANLEVSIMCEYNAGGAIGSIFLNPMPSATVTLRDIKTPSHHLIVKGKDKIGGLVGIQSQGSLKVERAVLVHTVSSADSDLEVITGTNTSAKVGGLVGSLNDVQGASFTDSKVQCPVRSGGDCGGFVGYAYLPREVKVAFKNCAFNSLACGKTSAGGLIGWMKAECNHAISIENVSVVVADGAAAKIESDTNAGGLFGCIAEGHDMDMMGTNRVAVNVSASQSYAGGVAGSVNDIGINFSTIEFSNTMQVSGRDRIGGLIGQMTSTYAVGRSANSFNYDEGHGIQIPKYSRFTPDFSGVVKGGNYTGGAIGRAEGSTIHHISVHANVSGKDYTGGVVGLAYLGSSGLKLEDCTFNGEVRGSSHVGGVVGEVANEGEMVDCINYGNVIATGSAVGGVCGFDWYYHSAPTFRYCVNLGNVSGSARVGGVVGEFAGDNGKSFYAAITDCANYGAVSSSGRDGHVGGILGKATNKRARVRRCANHGSVTSSSSGCVGGIAGTMGSDPSGVYASVNLELGECANFGTVSSSDGGSHVGGILGYQEEGTIDRGDHDSWLHDCYNEGAVTSKQKHDNGGILGCADHYSYVENCANFGKISHGNATIGTRKSSCIHYHDRLYGLKDSGKGWCCNGFFAESARGKKESYGGFDFDRVWTITDGTLRLRNCPFQTVKP